MQEKPLHSAQSPSRAWQTVTGREVAATLLDPRRLRYLKPFIGQEQTVAQVARELDVSPHRMLYQVRRLLGLGLIEMTRETPRAGRAVKHYRAVADGFFAPFELTRLDAPEQLAGQMMQQAARVLEAQVGRAWMAAGGGQGGWGVSVYRTQGSVADGGVAGGVVNSDIVPAPTPGAPRAFFEALLRDDAPAVWDSHFSLSLAAADAKALQRELSELRERYRAREQAGQTTYLIRLAMAPLSPSLELNGA